MGKRFTLTTNYAATNLQSQQTLAQPSADYRNPRRISIDWNAIESSS